MPFELINAETTNTIASFESEEEARRALEELARSRPELGELAVIVPFDEDGHALSHDEAARPSAPFESADIAADIAAWVGFWVEARDGSTGKIDDATVDAFGYLVVDTGPWIFGKQVLLPAGVIERVDFESETVFIRVTKDEVANAPRFDEERLADESYRELADRLVRD